MSSSPRHLQFIWLPEWMKISQLSLTFLSAMSLPLLLLRIKILTKTHILTNKSISKESPNNCPKNTPKIPPKYPQNTPKIPKNSQDFENIQFPTSHLEADKPFRLVFWNIYLVDCLPSLPSVNFQNIVVNWWTSIIWGKISLLWRK